jgi:hypothetical protein
LTNAPPGHCDVLLTELLAPDRVMVPLQAADRSAAIAALTRTLAGVAGASPD